jgi:hypothetical protein
LPALKTPKPWQHSKEPIEKLGQDVLAQVAKGLRTLPEFSDALQEENVNLFAILPGFSAWNRKKGNCTDYSAKQHIILPSLVLFFSPYFFHITEAKKTSMASACCYGVAPVRRAGACDLWLTCHLCRCRLTSFHGDSPIAGWFMEFMDHENP